jgi:hypothetical protein
MTVEPRTVEIDAVPYVLRTTIGPPDACGTHYRRAVRLVSSMPVPATLHACQEARNQRLYQQAFSEMADLDGAGTQYVWVNFDIDIIFIGCRGKFKDFKPVAPLIQRLKFERDLYDEDFAYFNFDDILIFVNVKEIYIVCDGGLRNWHGVSQVYSWPCDTENIFCIDPADGRMITGIELDIMFDEILEEGYRQEDERKQREVQLLQ